MSGLFTLLNPWGLLGLLSLPVIVVLHLRRERTRREVVSSLALWRFLDEKLSGRRVRTLPLTLLLLLDLLAALLFTLALARPELNIAAFSRPETHTILLIDTSTSMLAEDGAPTRLAAAQADAATLITASGADDVVSLIAFGGQARLMADSRDGDLAQVDAALAALQAGAAGIDLDGAFSLAAAVAEPDMNVEVHVFTDGAFGEPLASLSELPVHWHAYGSAGDNQGVLILEVAQYGANRAQVYAVLSNLSDQPVTRDAALYADGELVDGAPIDLPARASQPHLWTLTGHPQVVELILSGSDALPADDRAAYTSNPANAVRVTLVGPPSDYIERALAAVGDVIVTRVENPADVSAFDAELTIFFRTLPVNWPAGVALLVDPPEGVVADLTVEGLVAVDGRLHVEGDPLLAGVDFGGLRVEALRPTSADWLFPIVSLDAQPVIAGGRKGLTTVVLIGAPLDRGNLGGHPAFPLLIGNAVELAGGGRYQPHYGHGVVLPLPPVERVSAVSFGLVDEDPIQFDAQRDMDVVVLATPGVYQLDLTDHAGDTSTFALAANAGDTREIDIAPRAWLAARIAESVDTDVQAAGTLDLTPWLLLAALGIAYWEARRAWL